MKPRKPKANEPSLRDRLSEKFDADLLADYELEGRKAIAEARAKAPEKYLDTVSRRIAAVEPKTGGYEDCKTKEDLGRALLKSVGATDDEITEDMITEALKLNDECVDQLLAIKAAAAAAEDVIQ
jgi:hypothetical protein